MQQNIVKLNIMGYAYYPKMWNIKDTYINWSARIRMQWIKWHGRGYSILFNYYPVLGIIQN
jgi:hypothetical protein